MVTHKNILFCTDFSSSAQAALPHALDLAEKHGAALRVVHVYQEPGEFTEFEISSDLKMDWIRVSHLLGAEMEKKLRNLCGEISSKTKLCLVKMLRGKPHLEILRYAREARADLIVMASHGLSGLEHALFGSTAERVIRESPCHVLLIKMKTTE